MAWLGSQVVAHLLVSVDGEVVSRVRDERPDVGRRFLLECSATQLSRVGVGQEAHGLFDGGDRGRSHAELVDAESDQDRGCIRVGGDLAADRDPRRSACGLGGHGDQPEHCRVERVGELGSGGVAALCRQLGLDRTDV